MNMGRPIVWATLATRKDRSQRRRNDGDYKEYKPDTAKRKVGLLERVMDDQPAPGVDFGDW